MKIEKHLDSQCLPQSWLPLQMQPRQRVFDAFCVCSSKRLHKNVDRSAFVFREERLSDEYMRVGCAGTSRARQFPTGRSVRNRSIFCAIRNGGSTAHGASCGSGGTSYG